MNPIRHLDDRDLPAALANGDGPMLVDFHATWCGPCISMGSSLEALATESGGRLTIIKVDIDQAPGAANAFGVRSVPTLVLFDGGRVRDVRVGMQSLAQLRAWVADVIRGSRAAQA